MAARKTSALMLMAFLLLNATLAFAEHAPGERHTFRAILTTVGAIGGIAAGTGIGYSAGGTDGAAVGFLVGLPCGIVGGYFLGRKIDKSRIPKTTPDPQKIKEAQKKVVETLMRESATRFPWLVPAQPSGK